MTHAARRLTPLTKPIWRSGFSGTLNSDDNLAKDNDYQIWMERVDDSGKIGIVMVDGEVVADNQVPEPVEASFVQAADGDDA